MRTMVVMALLLVAGVCYSQPSSVSELPYGPRDLNFNILDHDSLRVWQTERDGHGIWWQDNATKDVFFLRTDTIGLFLWYLDNSAGTWTNIWSVDATGAQVADSTYLGDLSIGDDLVVTDDVTADSVYVRTLRSSGAAILGGALTVTGAASPEADGTRDLGTDIVKWDSVFAGHVKTTNLNASGAVALSTTLGVTGASTLDSAYARTVKTSGAASVGTTLGVTGASTQDSVYARTVKTSGAVSLGTTLGVTGASTLDSTKVRKLVLTAGTPQVIDSISAVHADTVAVWIGGKAFVLPVRP